ncbi:GxxExxY protein [Sediminibacterium soli]|uniref:GxxExxY protein n=1 Tax=Sediminibacterium soli TaxID=2698829 RepID=UPI00137A561B|nr:GxxExxY protein [Sediminibacterium soli]NCI47762.1 GxxExxY protein [Sediminibacterium soli]
MHAQEYNLLTHKIIQSAIEVHRYLGPGLLESVYEVCLLAEIRDAGLSVTRQLLLPVVYKAQDLQKDFMIDLLVENEIVIELKSLDALQPIHEAQLVTYLRLSGKKLGLLINFNVPVLKNGIRRKINGIL